MFLDEEFDIGEVQPACITLGEICAERVCNHHVLLPWHLPFTMFTFIRFNVTIVCFVI